MEVVLPNSPAQDDITSRPDGHDVIIEMLKIITAIWMPRPSSNQIGALQQTDHIRSIDI